MPRPTGLAAALFVLLLASTSASAEAFRGRVVGVADGDTLTLLTADPRTVRVRVAWVDAPEAGQPYGTRARLALSALAFGREAVAEVVDTDRYGRAVARVTAPARTWAPSWCASARPGCSAATAATRP